MKPILAIATVVKDNPAGLQRTGDSLVSQMREVEELFGHNVAWIIFNGGSKGDATDQKIQEFGSHVAYHESKPDKGIYYAMNRATDVAQDMECEYIWYLNSGDLAKPGAIKKICEAAKQGPGLVYSGIDSKGILVPPGKVDGTSVGMPLSHQATVFHVPTIGDMRYDTSFEIAADYKFMHQYNKKGNQAYLIPEPIAYYEGGGLSAKRWIAAQLQSFRVRREDSSISLKDNVMCTLSGLRSNFFWSFFPEKTYIAMRDIYRTLNPKKEHIDFL